MKIWNLNRIVQCAKCPWRKDTNPYDIPNGYMKKKHFDLKNTIAKEGDLSAIFSGELKIMACHEEHQSHCVGWLMNQIGVGNNIALRIQIMKCGNFNQVKLIGEQHSKFEQTLPKL